MPEILFDSGPTQTHFTGQRRGGARLQREQVDQLTAKHRTSLVVRGTPDGAPYFAGGGAGGATGSIRSTAPAFSSVST